MINKNGQRWDLLCQSDSRNLGNLISYIFSDQFIFLKRSFQKILLSDRKGFISIDQLINNELISDFFNNYEQTEPISKKNLIKYAIKNCCSELMIKGNRVRRVSAFNHAKLNSTKPVLIEKINSTLNISEIRDILGEDSFSPFQSFDDANKQGENYIFAEKYRECIKNHQKLPFRIVEYKNFCIERQRSSRYWQQHQRRYYVRIQPKESDRSRIQKHMESVIRRREMVGDIQSQMDYDDDQMREQTEAASPKAYITPNEDFNRMLENTIIQFKQRIDYE